MCNSQMSACQWNMKSTNPLDQNLNLLRSSSSASTFFQIYWLLLLWAIHKFLVVNSTLQPQYIHQNIRVASHMGKPCSNYASTCAWIKTHISMGSIIIKSCWLVDELVVTGSFTKKNFYQTSIVSLSYNPTNQLKLPWFIPLSTMGVIHISMDASCGLTGFQTHQLHRNSKAVPIAVLFCLFIFLPIQAISIPRYWTNPLKQFLVWAPQQDICSYVKHHEIIGVIKHFGILVPYIHAPEVKCFNISNVAYMLLPTPAMSQEALLLSFVHHDHLWGRAEAVSGILLEVGDWWVKWHDWKFMFCNVCFCWISLENHLV